MYIEAASAIYQLFFFFGFGLGCARTTTDGRAMTSELLAISKSLAQFDSFIEHRAILPPFADHKMLVARPQMRYVCSRCLNGARKHPRRVKAPMEAGLASRPMARQIHVPSIRTNNNHDFRRIRICRPQISHTYATSTNSDVNFGSHSIRHQEPNGSTRLKHRCLISITGPDSAKFLQGLTTQNITVERPESILYSGLLNAQGRVVSDALVYPRRDKSGKWFAYIEVDVGLRDTVYSHFKRHKLRSKVKIEKVEDWSVWAVWTENETGMVDITANKENVQVERDPRLPGFGFRVLAHESLGDVLEFEQTPSKQPIPQTSEESYHMRRYLNGIPEGPAEMIPGSALPLESNMDYMFGIDFKKGCYVGQELTIRTKHTGVVRKRILPVEIYPTNIDAAQTSEDVITAEQIPTSTSIKRISTTLTQETDTESEPVSNEQQAGTMQFTGREAGKFLSGMGDIGLALCRLEHMTKPDVEFGMKWPLVKPEHEQEQEIDTEMRPENMAAIKIRARVPNWHLFRSSELEKKGQNKVESVGEMREEHARSVQPDE